MTPAEVREVAKGALTERQFQAFLLVHEAGLSQKAGAAVLGIDRSGFRHHLNRAYDKLSVLPELQDWFYGSRPGKAPLQDAAGGVAPRSRNSG